MARLLSQITTVRRPWAFVVVAYAFVVTMLGTTLPTPLYPLYQRTIGFSGLMITIIYAVYAVGVLVTLLLFGRLSDEIGRRRMLLSGLALSVLSAVAFVVQGGLLALFVGRVLSGLSAGIFTGTATATLLDLAPPHARGRATLVATVANMGGLGLGPLVCGLVSQYAGLPLRLIFLVDLALLTPAVVGVFLMAEPTQAAGRLRLHRPELAVPEGVRGAFIQASIAGFAGFVVLGLFTAVAPSALGQLLGLSNRAVIGADVFAVFAASTVGQLLLPLFSQRLALPLGCAGLIAGMGLVGAGLQAPSLMLFTAGGIVAGLGQGLSFRAGMTAVHALAPPERRGAVTSSFFVVLYVGLSIPVVGVGLAAQAYGLQTAGTACAVIVALLAAVTLASLIRRP